MGLGFRFRVGLHNGLYRAFSTCDGCVEDRLKEQRRSPSRKKNVATHRARGRQILLDEIVGRTPAAWAFFAADIFARAARWPRAVRGSDTPGAGAYQLPSSFGQPSRPHGRRRPAWPAQPTEGRPGPTLLGSRNVAGLSSQKVEQKIGEGATGIIYRALWHGRPAARKVPVKADYASELMEEARIRFFGMSSDMPKFYYELLGENLGAFLARRVEMPCTVLVQVAMCILGALEHLHARLICHGDVRKQNVYRQVHMEGPNVFDSPTPKPLHPKTIKA